MINVVLACLALAPTDLVVSPLDPVLRFDEVGLYRLSCTYRSGKVVHFPAGWTGDFDEATGLAYKAEGPGVTLLHCPWRGGTGTSDQEFLIRLPRSRSISLKGSVAMGERALGKSDGATFRVFVNGKKRFEVIKTDGEWQPYSIDLASFAGKIVSIRFETDPGPHDESSFDFSLWKDRRIEFVGIPPRKQTVSSPALDLLASNSTGSGDVVPRDGDAGMGTEEDHGEVKTFYWRGVADSMEFRWVLPKQLSDPLLGSLRLTTRSGATLPLAQDAQIEWTAEARPAAVKRVPGGVEWTYRVGDQLAHLSLRPKLIEKTLVVSIECDKPVIKSISMGGWGPVAFRRPVNIPYYTGQVQYLPAQDLFANAYLDWTHSSASHQEGTRATYNPLTDGTRNLLRERVVFAASPHLAGALPSIPNPVSAYLKQVGGRLVLDTWGGRYSEIAEGLRKLAGYGIRDCTTIVHVWQRSGYDNALPAHYPADASLGGDPGMKELVATGTALGHFMALHENYVDYYPNYEKFNEQEISLDSQGKRVLAWYQPGTKIQSFAVQPNAILPLAKTQSPEIHQRYGTNANYLDVHSAVPPWFHVDHRAGEEGAGTFAQVRNAHQRLWQFERDTHGGPVFGEGNTHWFWSGMLDGVEAQFGSGWPANQGQTAPLMVDFDLLRMHPLQANHGMGYYERWWKDATWSGIAPLAVLDQYRMQEVAYGHTGFLAGSTWNKLPLAWLEHHLVGPVSAAYAGDRPSRIEYRVNRQWVNGDLAAKEGEWNQVRVTYSRGLVVTANSGNSKLNIGDLVLPPNGWHAQGRNLTAWTALRNGQWADYSETPTRVFANARNAAFWDISGVKSIRPLATSADVLDRRRVRIHMTWKVGEALGRRYSAFVHFTVPAEDEGIRFQADHPLAKPTDQWQAGDAIDDTFEVTVPESATGKYNVCVGLFQPGGERLHLQGLADGNSRIKVGTLFVDDNGVRFSPTPESAGNQNDWYQQHLNVGGKVIDFGTLRTNGSVHVVRQGNEWILQTLPRDANFTVELKTAKFGKPTSVSSENGLLKPIVKAGMWKLPLSGSREYRWKVSK